MAFHNDVKQFVWTAVRRVATKWLVFIHMLLYIFATVANVDDDGDGVRAIANGQYY